MAEQIREQHEYDPHYYANMVAKHGLADADDEASEAVTLGLQFRLKEGWKIYWRTPGDAGFPPQLDFSDSSNLAAALAAPVLILWSYSRGPRIGPDDVGPGLRFFLGAVGGGSG